MLAIFQERTVTVRDGRFSYLSGKDELRSVAVKDIVSVTTTSVEQFAFAITVAPSQLAPPSKAADASSNGREYMFRAVHRASFDYWLHGLEEHMRYWKAVDTESAPAPEGDAQMAAGRQAL